MRSQTFYRKCSSSGAVTLKLMLRNQRPGSFEHQFSVAEAKLWRMEIPYQGTQFINLYLSLNLLFIFEDISLSDPLKYLQMTRSKPKWPRRAVNGQRRRRNFQRKSQEARNRRRRRRRRKGPKSRQPPPPPPPVQFLVPQPQISHEIVNDGVDDCPESGSLSGFTFVNFLLSAIAVGANIVSNANR